MGSLDLILGPILLGTVFNLWLYGIMVAQTMVYYISFPRDHKWVKILVAYLFIVDTLNSAFDIGLVWRYTITLFGDLEGITRSHWFLNIEPIMTVMISSATQSFFAWRIVKLTGQAWLGWSIGFSAFVQFAAASSSTAAAFIVQDFIRFQEFKAAVITWLVLTAITDIVITCILIWYLHTHRTGIPNTDNIISRLVLLTVQTGLITTICAICNLVFYLAMTNTMHLFFQLPLCKLYTNCLMSTLNSRAFWGSGFASDDDNNLESRSRVSIRKSFSKAPPVRCSDLSGSHQQTEIQIVNTTTVHRDDGFELEEYHIGNAKQTAPENMVYSDHSQSRTAVPLPEMMSATAISDETSIHSRVSLDLK